MGKSNLSDTNYWRPFPSDDQYLVSKNGEIWSHKVGRELRGTITRRMSIHVTVYHKNSGGKKIVHYPVHILVMKVWGPAPAEGETHIRHLNGNSMDNRVKNLKWYNPHIFNGKNWKGL